MQEWYEHTPTVLSWEKHEFWMRKESPDASVSSAFLDIIEWTLYLSFSSAWWAECTRIVGFNILFPYTSQSVFLSSFITWIESLSKLPDRFIEVGAFSWLLWPLLDEWWVENDTRVFENICVRVCVYAGHVIFLFFLWSMRVFTIVFITVAWSVSFFF